MSALRPIAERRAEQETRAIYRLADALFGPFSCPATAECCQLTARGREPWLWPSEWRVLKAATLAAHGQMPQARTDGACPLLDATGKRCTVYADRPLGCRTFFCHRVRGPAQQPTLEMNALLERLERVNRVDSDDDVAADVEPLPLLRLFAEERNAADT